MNRALVLGIAIFFAVVGIALLGGESKAVAGHGCHGCHACAGCDCGGCVGACDGCHCSGRVGLLARLRARRCHSCRGCHACHGCHAVVTCCGCHGGGETPPPAETEAPPSEARQIYERVPFANQVSFRR